MEERVEVERDVGEEEGRPGVGVGGDTLEEGESIADPVALVGSEDGGVDGWVDVDNFLNTEQLILSTELRCGPDLQQSRHGPEAVPEHGSEVTDNLPLLTQLQQSGLPAVG